MKRRTTARTVVIGVCILIAALEGFDNQAFGVVAPRLAAAFGLNPDRVGWAASAAMVGLIIGAILGGRLADRVGRKPVLLFTVAGFGACSIWTALSPDFTTLLLARMGMGLGIGGAMPNLAAMAADMSPPSRRGATTCAMFCGMPAGGAAVAAFASLPLGQGDWRTVFLIGGALPLALTPVAFLLLPETRPVPDPAEDSRVIAALFGSQRSVTTLLLWMVNVLTVTILYVMLYWLPSLVVAQGHTPRDGAGAATAFNLAGVAGALVLGQIVDRFGYRWSMLSAYATLAIVMALLSIVPSMTTILGLSAGAGFLVVGGTFCLYGYAAALYPMRFRGVGAGAAIGVGRLGAVIGPFVAGQLRQAAWPAGKVLLALGPVALSTAALMVVLTLVSDARRTPAG